MAKQGENPKKVLRASQENFRNSTSSTVNRQSWGGGERKDNRKKNAHEQGPRHGKRGPSAWRIVKRKKAKTFWREGGPYSREHGFPGSFREGGGRNVN